MPSLILIHCPEVVVLRSRTNWKQRVVKEVAEEVYQRVVNDHIQEVKAKKFHNSLHSMG